MDKTLVAVAMAVADTTIVIDRGIAVMGAVGMVV